MCVKDERGRLKLGFLILPAELSWEKKIGELQQEIPRKMDRFWASDRAPNPTPFSYANPIPGVIS